MSRGQVEREPPAVGAIQLVTPGTRLRKEMFSHDRGKPGTRALTHMLRTQMKEVEQRKAAWAGRRPIHDAEEPTLFDEEVSRPEVAVSKPTRQGCESFLEPTPQIAQRFLMLREVVRTDLRVAGGRSEARAVGFG